MKNLRLILKDNEGRAVMIDLNGSGNPSGKDGSYYSILCDKYKKLLAGEKKQLLKEKQDAKKKKNNKKDSSPKA